MTTTTRQHEARYDPSMTGRPKCYYCPRCGRYVTANHVAESRDQWPSSEDAERAHYLFINMRDIGCNCGVRYDVVGRAAADAAHEAHLAEIHHDVSASS